MRKSIQHLAASLHENDMYHNDYEQERREQACIRNGDLEGLSRCIAELEMERVGTLSKNRLRNYKDLSIVAITLSSRSAIEGGLSPEVAFFMSDAFIQQIENMKEEDKILAYTRRAQAEYCLSVRSNAQSATTNPIVRRCGTWSAGASIQDCPFRSSHNDYRIAKSIEDSIDFAAKRHVWQRMIS